MDSLATITEEKILISKPALSGDDERNHPFPPVVKPEPEPIPKRALHEKPLMPISDTDLRGRISWSHIQSPHFVLSYDATSFEQREADVILIQLETIYHDIFNLTHESFSDKLNVYAIDLHTPMLLGRTTRTHFNVTERNLYLVRTHHDTIESELITAMTHAMRNRRYLEHYGITRGWAMLEDSFSVFLSERLRNDKKTFPFYGADPEIIAHYLKEHLPIRMLSHIWTSKQFANAIERYAIAGAFMIYLGDVLGDDKVASFSWHENEITHNSFHLYFGDSLEHLEERWVEQLPKAMHAYTEDERFEMIHCWLKCVQGKFQEVTFLNIG
jgi:hypothetical protein